MVTSKNKDFTVLSLGGGAYNVLNLLKDLGMETESWAICHKDYKHPGIKTITVGYSRKEYIPGVKKFMLPNTEIHVTIPYEIEKLFKKEHHFIILATLGGCTGSLYATAIMEKLMEESRSFTFIVSTPFSFEGRNRMQNANIFLQRFGNNPHVNILWFDDLRKDADLLLRQAFLYADWTMANMANEEMQLCLELKPFDFEKPKVGSGERIKEMNKFFEILKNEEKR